MDHVQKNGCSYVCVTGGEPLLQANVHILLKYLCDKGYIVSLETGGSLSTEEVDPRVHVILDIKCPDSGMSDKNHWENISYLRKNDEVKFVINGKDDYLYAKDICFKYDLFDKARAVLFSPVHGILDPKEIVGWILKDKLPVRLNLQIHKYIWSAEAKGV
jgi:7-carboxy-7-deazaguanine synthase